MPNMHTKTEHNSGTMNMRGSSRVHCMGHSRAQNVIWRGCVVGISVKRVVCVRVHARRGHAAHAEHIPASSSTRARAGARSRRPGLVIMTQKARRERNVLNKVINTSCKRPNQQAMRCHEQENEHATEIGGSAGDIFV